jgi:hypothetical protein
MKSGLMNVADGDQARGQDNNEHLQIFIHVFHKKR